MTAPKKIVFCEKMYNSEWLQKSKLLQNLYHFEHYFWRYKFKFSDNVSITHLIDMQKIDFFDIHKWI